MHIYAYLIVFLLIISLLLTFQMLIITLKNFAKLEFHNDVDSCIVVLLSHGVDGAIVGSDCENVPLQDLFLYFDGQNCPKLLRKPKLFFIQACRGGQYISNLMIHNRSNVFVINYCSIYDV